MIITAHTGTNFKGVLAYVYRENKELPEDQKPIILEENLVWGNSSSQASLMNKVTEKNSNSSRPVLHITVSYPKKDELSQEEINKHLKEIVKEFGATEENNQYTITAHKDSAKDIANGTAHYHIVINKVGLNGQNINTNFIKNKAHVIADKLEKQFDLEKTIGRKIIYEPENDKGWRFTTKQERAEVAQAKKSLEKAPIVREKRKSVKKVTDKIELKIFQVLVSQKTLAKTPEELVSTLAEKGVEVRFSYDKENNNAIRGASFRSEKVAVGGAKIGYNWDYINAHLEQNKAFYLKNAMVAQPVQQSFKDEKKANTVKPVLSEQEISVIKNDIKISLDEVLQTAITYEDIKEKLAEKAIEIKYKWNLKNQAVATFKKGGVSFKGDEIGYNDLSVRSKLRTNEEKHHVVAPTLPSEKQLLKEEQKAIEPTLNPISAIAPVQKVKENRAEKELGQNIAQIGKEVLQTAKSLPEFEYKLSVRGITIETLENSTGTYGIKFTQNGNSFKGSEIGLKIKEIEQKIQTNLDQEIAPIGATPIPTPTVEPFRKKEEPLVRKERNNTLFEWTLSEKEKAEKAHIPKANAELKKAIESYPKKYIDLVRHLQETNTIQERGNELVISIENNEVSTLNKEYLKGLQPKLNEKYWKWEKEMKAYKELISTPIKHGGWFEKNKDKQEREQKNKEIESAVEPPLILLTEEDKKEMMKALEIPNPYIEREHVYETERADFNGEVWNHNYEIDKIEEKKGKKRDNALDDEEPKRKNGITMKY